MIAYLFITFHFRNILVFMVTLNLDWVIMAVRAWCCGENMPSSSALEITSPLTSQPMVCRGLFHEELIITIYIVVA